MKTWRAYPSRITTEINSIPDPFVDAPESIGTPGDAAATANNSTNSAFSLMKGMCTELGITAGSGAGAVNTYPPVAADLEATLGLMSDTAATDTGSHSAISLLKGILAQAGI